MNTEQQLSVGTELAEAIRLIETYNKPQVVDIANFDDIEKAAIVLAPIGLQAIDLKPVFDSLWPQPKRRAGTAKVTDLASFIALANRFKADNSAIFADANLAAPSLTAVIDYHPAGGDNKDARFCHHAVHYPFPLSKEWLAWTGADGKVMTQSDFAAFIEDRIADVVAPDPSLIGDISEAAAGGDFGERSPTEQLAYLARLLGGTFALPNELMELSRGLSLREGMAVKNAVNLSTGEAKIQFISEHMDESGQPLRVPNLFLVAVPIFNNGAPHLIAIRLRYRSGGGKIAWFYQIYRVEKIFDHAFKEACTEAQTGTGLPLYFGAPEKPGR